MKWTVTPPHAAGVKLSTMTPMGSRTDKMDCSPYYPVCVLCELRKSCTFVKSEAKHYSVVMEMSCLALTGISSSIKRCIFSCGTQLAVRPQRLERGMALLWPRLHLTSSATQVGFGGGSHKQKLTHAWLLTVLCRKFLDKELGLLRQRTYRVCHQTKPT